jgi:hypothetical protein
MIFNISSFPVTKLCTDTCEVDTRHIDIPEGGGVCIGRMIVALQLEHLFFLYDFIIFCIKVVNMLVIGRARG